jgi:hypothetical protein
VSAAPARRVLAIDPGREKCGLAAVDAAEGLLERAVVPRSRLPDTLRDWCARHRPDLLLLGSGTGSHDLLIPLGDLPVPLRQVPERDSTRLARERYFTHHPPRGWRRLIPRSLQTPPVPVDDYAAWVLADQFLRDLSPDESIFRRLEEI